MAPAKRKATGIPTPEETSARLSTKKTMLTTTEADIEGGEMKQEAPTRAPRVQVPHACKERLDDLTRALDFKSLGSTINFLLPTAEGAKSITELTRELGYDNGGRTIEWLLQMVRTKESLDFQNARRQLDWLLPTQTEWLQELTKELCFERGGQTVDWILPMASKDFLKLTHLLGFQESAHTIQWLLNQAKPAIAARIARQYGSTGPPYSTAQFSQNPEGVRPSTFTPRAGVGRGTTLTPAAPRGVGGSTTWYSSSSEPHTPIPSGGSTTWYSSNPHIPTSSTVTPTPTPTPTPVQSSKGTVTEHRSHQPIPNTYLNGTPTPRGGLGGNTTWYPSNLNIPTPSSTMPTPTTVQSRTGPVTAHRSDLAIPNSYFNGFRGGQPQMNGYGQFQRGYVFDSARMMQPTSPPQSQQASPHNIQVHNRVGSRLRRTGKVENNRAASNSNIVGPEVGAGVEVSRPMQYSKNSHPNQLQEPQQANHLISGSSNSLHELRGTCNAQTHTRAMQLPVENGDTASNDANQMSSGTSSQDIIQQIQAPADHCPTEIRIEGHDPNQLHPSHCNEVQSPSIQFPINVRCTQINGETPMAELPLTNNQIMDESCTGLQVNSRGLLNGAGPLAGLNETHPHEEDENQVKENWKPMNELGNTEIETQREKKQEVNECANVICEVEGHQDGGSNEGLLIEAEATRGQMSDTNIVEEDAVDPKDAEASKLTVMRDARVDYCA